MAPLHQVTFVVGYVIALVGGIAWLWRKPLSLETGDVISAVAAIASVGAVWAAIHVAGRSERGQRQRDAAKVIALRVLAKGLSEVAGYRSDPAKLNEGTVELLGGLRVIFEGIVVLDLPSPKSVDLYMLIATRLHILCRVAQELEAGKLAREAAAAVFAVAQTDLVRYALEAEEEAARLLQGAH